MLLPPGTYDEMARAGEAEIDRDIAAIRKAMKEFDEGRGIPIEEAHRRLRAELLSMKAAQDIT